MDRIKRLSYEVLDTHKSKFGEDFADNKKVLDQISIIRSKGLKNEVAGYITKFIKNEIREEKNKQSRIESVNAEQPEVETVDPVEDILVENVAEPTTTENVAEPTTTENVAEPTTTENVAEPTTTENVAEPTTTENVAEPTTTENVAEPTTTENVAEPTTEQ